MGLRQLRMQGDDILTKKAKPVKEITPAILTLLDDMKDTLDSKEAVGIAAPQVGILRRIALVSLEDEFYELINPEIIETEGTQICNEACLSVMQLCGDIERPMRVVVRATNRHGEEYTIEGEDFMASIISHELDHLDGVLFTDKAENIRPQDEDDRRERRERRKTTRQRTEAARNRRKVRKDT